MRFNKLPNEIKFDVFATIPAHVLTTKIAPVCREWRQWAYEPILWKNVKLNGHKQPKSQMIVILNHATQIRQLEIKNVALFSWINFIPGRKSLREIDLETCTLSPKILSKFVELYPHVERQHCLNVTSWSRALFVEIIEWKFARNICLIDSTDENKYIELVKEKCENIISFAVMDLSEVLESSFIDFFRLRGLQLGSLCVGGLDNLSCKTLGVIRRCSGLQNLELFNAKNLTNENFCSFRVMENLISLTLHRCDKLFSKDFPILFSQTCFPYLESIELKHCSNFNWRCFGSLIHYCLRTKTIIFSRTQYIKLRDCKRVADRYQFQISATEDDITLTK